MKPIICFLGNRRIKKKHRFDKEDVKNGNNNDDNVAIIGPSLDEKRKKMKANQKDMKHGHTSSNMYKKCTTSKAVKYVVEHHVDEDHNHHRWLLHQQEKIGLFIIMNLMWATSFWMGCIYKNYQSRSTKHVDLTLQPPVQVPPQAPSLMSQRTLLMVDHHLLWRRNERRNDVISASVEKQQQKHLEKSSRIIEQLRRNVFKRRAQELVHPSMLTSFDDPKHVVLLLEDENQDILFSSFVWNELVQYKTLKDITFVFLTSQQVGEDEIKSKQQLLLQKVVSSIIATTKEEKTSFKKGDDDVVVRPRIHIGTLSMRSQEDGGSEGTISYTKLTSHENSKFDVVLWIDPYKNLKFKNEIPTPSACSASATSSGTARWNTSRLYHVARYLSSHEMNEEGGILSMPLGPGPVSSKRNNHALVKLQIDLINAVGGDGGNADTMDAERTDVLPNFIESHIYQQADSSSASLLDSYVIFCKNTMCRNHRALEHEGLPLLLYRQMKQRHSLPSSSSVDDDKERSIEFLDMSISFASQSRPPKVWETLYCSSGKHKEQCDFFNGYNPRIPNIYQRDLEVKQSSLGSHVGRGLFTLRDIHAGSLILAEQQAHYLIFKPHMYNMMMKTAAIVKNASTKNDTTKEEEDPDQLYSMVKEFQTLDNYIHSYPFADYTYGDYGWIGDVGIGMFSNHGCDPSNRHFGDLATMFKNVVYKKNDEEEAEEDATSSLQPLYYYMSNPDGTLFNPLMDRRFGREVTSEGIVQSAKAGQELFCGYTTYAGDDPNEWEQNVQDLYEQCNHHKVGRVVEVDFQ